MTKELISESKLFIVNFELNGAEIKAAIEVSNEEYNNWEKEFTLKSISSESDIDEDEAEEYIVANWKKFKEIK